MILQRLGFCNFGENYIIVISIVVNKFKSAVFHLFNGPEILSSLPDKAYTVISWNLFFWEVWSWWFMWFCNFFLLLNDYEIVQYGLNFQDGQEGHSWL